LFDTSSDSEVFKLLVFVILAALATLSLIDLGNDWIANALQVLHLLFKIVLVGFLVRVEPIFSFGEGVGNGGLVVFFEFVGQLVLIFNCVAHLIDVVLECVLSVNAFLDCLVLIGKLLSVQDHLLDLFLGEATLVISNGNVLSLSSSLLNTADSQDGVLVNFERDFDLRNTSLRRWNASQIKLTELMVVLDQGTFSLKDSDGDSGLLVLVGGEGLGLFGGDNGSTLNDWSHNTSNGLNSEGKRGHIDEKNVLGFFGSLTSEDTTLDRSTVSDSLIWVDTTVWLLTVEVFLEKLLDLWDTCRSSNKHDFVNLGLLKSAI